MGGGDAVPANYLEIATALAEKAFDATTEAPIGVPDYNGDLHFTEGEGAKWQYENKPLAPRPLGIAESALSFVGNTPMIRLTRLHKALGLPEGVDLLGKAECYSAGGSVKDRIAMRMIEDAEREGRIRPGDVLIEATSGNTGVGLCMAGAIKGYKVIITMPKKMSGEKLNMMKALGATVYRTPTEAGFADADSHISLALRLQHAIPRSHILDQYKNSGNYMAHYDGTGQEIVDQTEDKLDYLVISAGTGGTITGCSKKVKERIPDCKVVGVDPTGSILAIPDNLNDEDRLKAYEVEGIGYDFIPTVLDRGVVDHWVKTKDDESFRMARSLIKREGIMCGGSCGSAMAGAVKAIKELNITSGRVVVLFADHSRNYMSKFLDDDWMTAKGFDLSTF